MTPIINPWIFYVIDICNNIKNILSLIIPIFCIGTIGLFVGWIIIGCGNNENLNRKGYIKVIKTSVIILCTSFLFSIFIPSKETIEKMIIAQNVTYERMEIVGETVKNVYDDIMNIFENQSDKND